MKLDLIVTVLTVFLTLTAFCPSRCTRGVYMFYHDRTLRTFSLIIRILSMTKYITTLLFLTFQFALVTNANAYDDHEYGLFCDSCSTSSDFETFAIANTPKRLGVSVTSVANYNTNEIYVVTMEWEKENQVWYHFVTDVSPGSQELVDGFIAAKGLFTPNVYLITAPPGTGDELYGAWSGGGGAESAAVSYAIVATTAVSQAALANAFWNSFAARFFGYPVAVFIF